jgi:hypothetical protein
MRSTDLLAGRSLVFGLLAAGVVGLLACTGGAGLYGGLAGDDPSPSSFEDPGSSTESAPSAGDQPGSSAEGPVTSGGSACPPCDRTFRCETVQTETANGASTTKTESSGITLSSTAQGCSSGDDDDDAIFACGGQILIKGQSVGTWTTSGGGFDANISVTGQGGSVTISAKCTPGVPDQPGEGTGEGDGNGNGNGNGGGDDIPIDASVPELPPPSDPPDQG